MVRPTAQDIEIKIRHGLTEEVAEMGMGSVSVARVAKKAGISPGTLYLHYENKVDMMQRIYLQIKTEFHGIIIAARDEPDSAAMVKRMWFDLFEFVSTYPNDFLYIESVAAAQMLSEQQTGAIKYMQEDIASMLQRAIDDGTLAKIPVSTTIVMLVAPAMHIARVSVLNKRTVTKKEVTLTFERVWLSIKASA